MDNPNNDTPASPTGQNQAAPAAAEAQGAETVDWKAEAEKWKALSRKNEAQAKANADAARRLTEIEDRDKTELQKAQEAAAAAEKRALAAETESLRARIAAAKGVAPDLLSGTTEEEITASADRLLAWRAEAVKAPASSPSADAGARGKPVGEASQLTRDDLKSMTPKQINEARQQGRLDQIMGV